MNNLKAIGIVMALLISAALLCSFSANSLLTKTEDNMDAYANIRAWDTMSKSLSTVDSLATGNVISTVVMSVIALLLVIVVIVLVVKFARSHDTGSRAFQQPAAHYLSLGDNMIAQIARLNKAQQKQMLQELYTACDYLEASLGYQVEKLPSGKQEMTVYQDSIDWGKL